MAWWSNFLNRIKPTTLRSTKRTTGYSGGTFVNESSAMEVAAYYRGVIYISTQIAKLPWEVKDDNNENIKDSPIWYLLNISPNSEMTAMSFKLFLIQCAINQGNGYAEIERSNDGRPIALWPLDYKSVRPLRTPDGTLLYEVTSGDMNGDTVYMKPKDLYIVRNPHTLDGIQGEGVIAYALRTLGISLGADGFANGLYANGGLPSGVITHPARLDDATYARLKESWKEQHGGRKTGGTAVLEEGVTYTPISHSPDVLQFIESRKFGIAEISRFLGLPPTKLFDTESAKFNNVENANLEVATDTLDTWARIMESEADMKLLAGRKGGRRTEMDLYAIFRGDMETRANYFSKMMQSAAMTPNQIRLKEGMSPYDGGDRYYIASNNMTPEDRVDQIIDSQIKQKEQPTTNTNTPPPKNEGVELAVVKFLESKTK